MNNDQHRLYQLEVTPPVGAWENIATELNEIDEFAALSQKLNAATSTPPAFIWDNISFSLHEEERFEVIGEKLSQIHIAPPASVWHRIETALIASKSETLAKVTPLQQPHSKKTFIPYAAAACIIGLLGFLGYRMMERSSKSSVNIEKTIEANNNAPVKMNTAPTVNDQKLVVKREGKTNAPDSSTLLLATAPLQETSTVMQQNNYATTIEKNKDIDGRYIMLMTNDGDVVRMSKKLGKIADCIAGETESSNCNEQIAHWQKEMATTPMLTSPDNILDLLELANKESNL